MEPRIITTVDELADLPKVSAVLDSGGVPHLRDYGTLAYWISFTGIFKSHMEMKLPATVIYTPEDDTNA